MSKKGLVAMNSNLTQPHEASLSEQAKKLLTAIESSESEWLTRNKIAQRLGKRRLNPYEVALLGVLKEQGLIEVEKRDDPTPIGYRYEYRVKNETA
jgi:hypothetical protein